MVQGVSIVARILDANWQRQFVVYYDPDPDGVFAGHSVHEFLDLHKKPHFALININRGHGIIQDLSNYKGGVVINVDSGVSWDKLKELVDMGVTVVSIDHHEIEGTPSLEDNYLGLLEEGEKSLVKQGLLYYCNEELGSEGVVLNNQYSFEDNDYRFMSGCGVVLDVLNQLNPNFAQSEHTAWHGITLLSDSREIENPIARDILTKTYSTDIESTDTIKHLTDTIGFNKFEIGDNTLDRSYIDFYLSPFINAMLRLNMGYEAIQWFSGGVLRDTTVKEQQKRILTELRSRLVSAEMGNLLIANVEKYSTDYFEASNFIGLLANRMLIGGKTVVITCTQDGVFQRGSVRGYFNSTDYRGLFSEAGLIALGHKGAFGLKSYSTDTSFWDELDRKVGIEDEKAETTYQIHSMRNLASNRSKIRELAYENQFLRPFHKHYIRYTGLKCFPTTFKENFQEYTVDGIPMRCFDSEANIRNSYILPSMSKGYMSLYLERISV